MTSKIHQALPKEIFEKLKNVNFFYEGFHNWSFTAHYQGQKVQIRIIKNQKVDHLNEIIFLQNNSAILFIDSKGNYIKKWIEGKDLESVLNVKQYWNRICKAVMQMHTTSIKKQLQSFDWYQLNIKDSHFELLLKKYTNMPLVLCHNDLRLKNIILGNDEDIHLIDFEWVRFNTPYFDYASLFLYCNVSQEYLVNFFQIDKLILKDFIYLTQIFNQHWNKTKYKVEK